MPQQEYPHYDAEIDHPAQPTWSKDSILPFNPIRQLALANRFQKSGEDMPALFDALELTSIHTDHHRSSHEDANLFSLGLVKTDPEYRSFAGVPYRAEEYIRWFAHKATAACIAPTHSFRFDDISLELGGRRQGGDWEATHRLDEMIRILPGALNGERATLLMHEPSEEVLEVPKKYLLMPRFTPMQTSNGIQMTYSFATLVRTRPVADILVPGAAPVRLSKRSTAVIIMSQLDPETRGKIYRNHDQPYDQNKTEKLSTAVRQRLRLAADAAGVVFEKATKSEIGSTLDVVPIGAQYLMKVVRSSVK